MSVNGSRQLTPGVRLTSRRADPGDTRGDTPQPGGLHRSQAHGLPSERRLHHAQHLDVLAAPPALPQVDLHGTVK